MVNLKVFFGVILMVIGVLLLIFLPLMFITSTIMVLVGILLIVFRDDESKVEKRLDEK